MVNLKFVYFGNGTFKTRSLKVNFEKIQNHKPRLPDTFLMLYYLVKYVRVFLS